MLSLQQRLQEKLAGNYIRTLHTALNKSWKQPPPYKKQQF